jgi:hypothetical protein
MTVMVIRSTPSSAGKKQLTLNAISKILAHRHVLGSAGEESARNASWLRNIGDEGLEVWLEPTTDERG